MDYLNTYMTEKGLDLPKLINDDFFEAIKILLRERRFISALKLLMSFIDTIGYLEFGESKSENVFRKWLETHVKLQNIGVSSLELWEYRNGLLHMSNLQSRRVECGEVKMLIACVGMNDVDVLPDSEQEGYFKVETLVQEVINGIENCLQWFSKNLAYLPMFLERYDLLVSDHRVDVLKRA